MRFLRSPGVQRDPKMTSKILKKNEFLVFLELPDAIVVSGGPPVPKKHPKFQKKRAQNKNKTTKHAKTKTQNHIRLPLTCKLDRGA